MQGVTDAGRRLFGEFLLHCAQKKNLNSQEAIASWVSTQSGYTVPESQIRSLIKGKWERSFNFNYLFAILDSGILEFEDGELLEYADILETFRGRFDPFTRKKLTNGADNLKKP